MEIKEFSAHDLAAVADLCAHELVLDRDAAALPGVLMRRPFIGLVAMRGPRTIAACFGSIGETAEADRTDRDGFIDLLVVEGSARRQGVARRLVGQMEDELAARGCGRIKIEGHSPHYAWPGIDIHYTAAICMAQDLGYLRGRCEVNMDIDLLRAPLDTRSDEEGLRSQGIEIRRASSSDDETLQRSLGETWIPDWVVGVSAALRSNDGGVHIAVRNESYVGFCAYGVNRVHEVGPLGTAPEFRKLRIGSVLLKRCLAEQRQRGLTSAELIWVGPLSYYSRTVNATIGRAFWQFEKDLAAVGRPGLDHQPRHCEPEWLRRIGLV